MSSRMKRDEEATGGTGRKMEQDQSLGRKRENKNKNEREE